MSMSATTRSSARKAAMRSVTGGVVVALLLVGCSSGPSTEELGEANSRIGQLETELSAAQAAATELQDTLDASEADKASLADELEAARAEAEENLALADQRQIEIDRMALQYDPAIQKAIQTLESEAISTACDYGRSDAQDDYFDDAPISRFGLELPPGAQGVALEDVIDEQAVLVEYERCFKERKAEIKQEKDKAKQEKQQARLTQDKGDGFYTVGEEIAPGTWRSTGGGDACYWERLSGFSGEFEDIITNYFGTAGVTVTISSSDAAFKTERCGMWEYVG